MIGDTWTAEQQDIAREMRMLGHSFIEIAKQIGLQLASDVSVVSEARGWTVPLAQFEAEYRRCTESVITGAAADLTNRGKTVERIGDLQVYRVDGIIVRAAGLLDMAEAAHDR